MSEIHRKLMNVQSTLKAPKGQLNKFGNYKYRSLEDIMEAVKPILKEEGLTLVISDKPLLIGERHYLESEAVLTCVETGYQIVSSAVAMEPAQKKGMDSAQISGATSSYCRKYLCNGLFAIDDTKDADTQDNSNEGKPKPRINKKQMQAVVADTLALLADGDALGMKQIWDELSTDEQTFCWPQFDTAQKNAIKALLHAAKDQ